VNGDAYPAGVPVLVSIMVYMERPEMHYRRGKFAHLLRAGAPARPCGARKDLDKFVRGILDALKKGGAYADDGQVADLIAAKVYCAPGQQPGARIDIEPCKEGTTNDSD